MSPDVIMVWHFLRLSNLFDMMSVPVFIQDADDNRVRIGLVFQCTTTSLDQSFFTYFSLKAQDARAGSVGLFGMSFVFQHSFNKCFNRLSNGFCFPDKLFW